MTTGAGRRVLLVEDAAEVRMLLAVVLEVAGFVVTEAEDGTTGLTAAREQRPDVVLLDVQLPELDGPDVLRALKASDETTDVPVVFLTASDADADELLLGLGARGVLRKPFDPDTVAEQLAALL